MKEKIWIDKEREIGEEERERERERDLTFCSSNNIKYLEMTNYGSSKWQQKKGDKERRGGKSGRRKRERGNNIRRLVKIMCLVSITGIANVGAYFT